mmetsp:Transcript_13506/g.32729  ORF Transcript_13506/g.32729 Transcript_13506/m.32729 type:complete len:159 (-) Transcript_13506:186-662(-)
MLPTFELLILQWTCDSVYESSLLQKIVRNIPKDLTRHNVIHFATAHPFIRHYQRLRTLSSWFPKRTVHFALKDGSIIPNRRSTKMNVRLVRVPTLPPNLFSRGVHQQLLDISLTVYPSPLLLQPFDYGVDLVIGKEGRAALGRPIGVYNGQPLLFFLQ